MPDIRDVAPLNTSLRRVQRLVASGEQRVAECLLGNITRRNLVLGGCIVAKKKAAKKAAPKKAAKKATKKKASRKAPATRKA